MTGPRRDPKAKDKPKKDNPRTPTASSSSAYNGPTINTTVDSGTKTYNTQILGREVKHRLTYRRNSKNQIQITSTYSFKVGGHDISDTITFVSSPGATIEEAVVQMAAATVGGIIKAITEAISRLSGSSNNRRSERRR